MKRRLALLGLIAAMALPTYAALALDSCRLVYKLQPGQVWISEAVSQYKSAAGGEAMQPTRYTVRYRVQKGDRPGWVKLEAKITSHSAQAQGGGMDYSKLTYTADMHSSGELRHIAHTGSPMPPMPEEQLAQMPPQYAAMLRQSGEMMAKALQPGVFWFPELPEDRLSIGDSFDVTEKLDAGSSPMMQMQTVVKTEYTLEDVSEGLAYFSVRQRSQSKSGGMGMSTDTKTAGKADAVFDLEQGMWVEMTTKTQISGSYSGAGMAGQTGGVQLSRFRMRLQ